MKDYIKPAITLASLFPVAFAAGTCTVKVTSDDLTEIFATFGVTDPTKAFAQSDGSACSQSIPDGVTSYCKYTSTADATGTVLVS